MCNLYSNMTTREEMARLFSVRPLGDSETLAPQPAVFPRNPAATIVIGETGTREVRRQRWGFLLTQVSKRTGRVIKPKAVTNARSETIRTSAFWRDSFRHRRCLVPSTAYCESKGRSPAIYHWFGLTDPHRKRRPFAFAGIWKTSADDGQDLFAIATTPPNDFAARFHHRMPLILESQDYEQWLTGTEMEAAELLRPSDPNAMFVIAKGANLRVCPQEAILTESDE